MSLAAATAMLATQGGSGLAEITVLAQAVDEVQLNFDQTSLLLLNAIIGLIMFGVALDVSLSDLRDVLRRPKAPLIGVGSQFLLLPGFTFLLTRLLDPAPSIALGMILVSCCPGGNVSNIITHLAKGNTGLSIGMTGVSTLAAAVLTPLNFAFWGSLHPSTDELLRSVAVSPTELAITIGLLLAVPVTAGITLRARRPALAKKLYRPMRAISIVFFLAFIVIAFVSNIEHFTAMLGTVALAVLLHNALALTLGYTAGWVAGLEERDRRATSIEVGIQNSALALVLIFSFFGGLGGMALVAAWWGIWHIIAGLSLATFWSRRPTGDTSPLEAVGS
jgi:bile acid:Na+ symporter, BASS family